MIRVIDGKRYNTETAEKLANGSSNCGKSDFSWFDEDLYVTPKGNYFLASEGYANSKYAESYGGMRGAGEGLIPLTRHEALEWCERQAEETIDAQFDTLVTDA